MRRVVSRFVGTGSVEGDVVDMSERACLHVTWGSPQAVGIAGPPERTEATKPSPSSVSLRRQTAGTFARLRATSF